MTTKVIRSVSTPQFCLTCLLLPQVFHGDISQHCTGHQRSQDAEHDAHYIVVADQDDRAHGMNLAVDRNLNKGKKDKKLSARLRLKKRTTLKSRHTQSTA